MTTTVSVIMCQQDIIDIICSISKTNHCLHWSVPAKIPKKTLPSRPSYLKKLFYPGRVTSKNSSAPAELPHKTLPSRPSCLIKFPYTNPLKESAGLEY